MTDKMSLSDAIAISMTGKLPPHATEAQAAMLETLRAENANWRPFHNGGGTWAFALDIAGDCIALCSDGDMDFPTADDWIFGIYAGGGEALFGANNSEEWGRDGIALESCLAKANELIATRLPEALFAEVHDRASAEAWIEALNAARMGFHFEDDPATIIWHEGPGGGPWSPSAEEIALLKEQVRRLYEVKDWGAFECPIGYLLAVEGCLDPEHGDDTVAGELRAKIRSGEIKGYERLLPENRVVDPRKEG